MSFNDYFETFKGLAVEGAQTVAKKSKELATTAKANFEIRAEEEKIKKAQIELGKLYYKDYIVGELPDPAEYNPWCEKISESKIAIEDLKISIEESRTEAEAAVEEDDEEEFVVEITEEDLVSPEMEIIVEQETECDCDKSGEDSAE